MKYWIPIFIFISACRVDDKYLPPNNDSIEILNTSMELKDSLRLMDQSMYIRTTDAKYNHIIDSLKEVSNKYQLLISAGQLSQIQLEEMKAKVRNLGRKITELLSNVSDLNAKKQSQHDSIVLASHKIESQQEHMEAIATENYQLQQSLKNRHENFKPILSNITITPCGFKHSSKIYTTYNAKDVKRVEIRYISNPNPKDTEAKHTIKTSLLKALGFKGLSNILFYRNEPNFKQLVTFDGVDAFIPGEYIVKITIDEEQVFLSTLTLK